MPQPAFAFQEAHMADQARLIHWADQKPPKPPGAPV
jgi:hypothetical protein